MDGWNDGWMDGWMDGRMDGWMEEWMNISTCTRRADVCFARIKNEIRGLIPLWSGLLLLLLIIN